jgi:glutathione S-transferase
MEQHLARRSFFVNERYSIADIALYAYTHCAGDGGYRLDDYPQVTQWLRRVERQPRFVPMKDTP